MRANATFAAGVGFLHLAGAEPSLRAAGGRERFLDVIGDLLEASGASAHFLDNPLQRIKRDVDVI